MRDLNDKVTDGTLSADEWNDVPSELQNIIEALGIALSGGDLNQLGKAIAGYVANGTFYTDSGAADAYVLTQIGSKQVQPSYTDGTIVRFLPTNGNTGASTVNVAGLGVKVIEKDGVALVAGDIVTGDSIEMWYDGTVFQIVHSSVTATETVAGILKLTTQALQEAGTDNTVAVSPGRQHLHPSAGKAWVKFDGTGSILSDYGVSSVGDNDVGDFTVNWDTNFSTADYACVASCDESGASKAPYPENFAVGSVDIIVSREDEVKVDPNVVSVIAFGDQ